MGRSLTGRQRICVRVWGGIGRPVDEYTVSRMCAALEVSRTEYCQWTL
jgi:hypothetical protein